MKSRTKHNFYQLSCMQQRRRHRRHTAAAQGTYQGACLVHARLQVALYNQQQSTTLNVGHLSPVTHATKATAHTARPWPRTIVICNGHAATDPQYTYPYPYYARTIYVPPTDPWSVSTRLVLTRLPIPSPSKTEDHHTDALQLFKNATYAYTIYVPQTYAWSVSTRLVLTCLPIPSPSTTEDHNTSALQLFSECHLRLHYIYTANLCMVGVNKACTNVSARSKPADDRGSKRICTTIVFRMPPLVAKPYGAAISLSSSSRCLSTCGTHWILFDDSPQPLSL